MKAINFLATMLIFPVAADASVYLRDCELVQTCILGAECTETLEKLSWIEIDDTRLEILANGKFIPTKIDEMGKSVFWSAGGKYNRIQFVDPKQFLLTSFSLLSDTKSSRALSDEQKADEEWQELLEPRSEKILIASISYGKCP